MRKTSVARDVLPLATIRNLDHTLSNRVSKRIQFYPLLQEVQELLDALVHTARIGL